jgi:hypothetical protein
MASLRDVLNHAGKRVTIAGAAGERREGLAMRRGDLVLLEPRLEPKAGEEIRFLDSDEAFRLEEVEPQESLGKVDHYRGRLASLRPG